MDKLPDNFWIGFAIGFVGPLIGFVIFGNWYAGEFHMTFNDFVTNIFMNTASYRSAVASVCLFTNGVIFFIFSRAFKHKTMRGMLIATFMYVPVVLYLYFAK